MTQKEKQFVTFDLGLASALVSLNFQLKGIDKTNPKKARFIFSQSKEVEKVMNNYWSDKLSTNARTLFDNQKMLKNRIYSQ